MKTVKTEKCAHPVCSCPTTSGGFCSLQCAAMEKIADVDCSCGHSNCKGRTSH